MKNQHYGILCVTIATLFITGAVAATLGRNEFLKQPRFLFSSANVSFCNWYCPLSCPHGYAKSPAGCYLCHCVNIEQTTANVTAATQSLVSGGTFLDNPCDPAVRYCRLDCSFGFELGTNGCKFCSCKHGLTTNSLSTKTYPNSVQPSTLSVSIGLSSSSTTTTTTTTTTTITTLATSLLTAIRLTNSPPTSQTTLSQDKHLSNFSDPCIPSQITCDKDCNGDYVKGPGGCQYCLCGTQIPPEFKTTMPPEVTDGSSTTVPHYLDLTPTSEACIMAKLICNQKCSLGFVSHPDDCLFCSCKPTNLDSINDEPAHVILPNPCLEGHFECGLTCDNDYISGPRDCVFCSCR